MHENKNSPHVTSILNSPVDILHVHLYNDYYARNDNNLLNPQISPSPILFAESHVSEPNLYLSINHDSYSKLSIQGSSYLSQSAISSITCQPTLSDNGIMEQLIFLPNLHMNEFDSSLTTPVMAGGCANRSFTHIHHESEWTRMSCTNLKPSRPSSNNNRRDDDRNESFQ